MVIVKRLFQDVSSEELRQLEAVLKKIGKRAESLVENKVVPRLDKGPIEYRVLTESTPALGRWFAHILLLRALGGKFPLTDTPRPPQEERRHHESDGIQ